MNQTQNRTNELWVFAFTLAAMIALFWWRVWTPFAADRMHFTDDILIKDFATRMGMFRTALSGSLPLWDPYQFGGWPGVANCEAGFFYPFHWLMAPFIGWPETAYLIAQLTVMLHLFIAGMGAYRLSREIGLSPWGAALCAIAFTFCGFHCAHKKHTNMLFALVWFPWLLLWAERWARSPQARSLWPMTLLLALAFLAGHPQAALYMSLLLIARMLYGVWTQTQDAPRTAAVLFKRCLPIAVPFAVGFAIAAAQWFPTLEMIALGERAEAGQFARSTEFSMPPYELIDAVLPEALRNWSQVEVFYWGIIPLLLALFTVLRGNLNAFEKYLLASGLIAIGLSMGEWMFLYDISYVLVPGVAWVRAPSRWIYFASLPVAFFAGAGLDWVRANAARMHDSNEARLFYRVVSGAGALLIIVLLLVVLMNTINAGGGAATDEISQRLLISVIWLAFFAGAFFLLLRLVQTGKCPPTAFAVCIIALAWIDLGVHYRNLDLAPGAGGYPADPLVDEVRSLTWNHRAKVFLGGGGIRNQYHGAAQGFYELDGNSPLTPQINLSLRQDTALVNPDNPNLTLLQMCGVGAIVNDSRRLPLEYEWRLPFLYLSQTPPIRARATRDVFQTDLETQRELLALQSFPYNDVVLVETDDATNAKPVPAQDAVFCKPFLLASASANAVKHGAYLIINGENVFDELVPPDDSAAGYYFAVAHPKTGMIEKKGYFNLMFSISVPGYPEHERMANFIESVPEGRIVFAAVRDNASDHLLAQGLGVFRAIGASVDVRTTFRLAHAVVGVKGAPLGSALEVASATEALVLQSNKKMYISGSKSQQPKPDWIATGTFAEDWYRLFEDIHDTRFAPWKYAGVVPPATETPPIVAPMVVFSSIQPWESLDGDMQVGKAGILIGGVDHSLNKRGYNLVAYNAGAQKVIASENFDLADDLDLNNPQNSYVKDPPAENIRMREFIEDAPDGTYILGALCGEGTDLLLRKTVDLLRENGSQFEYHLEPDSRKHLSHAFVMIKGTTQCSETFQWQGPDSIAFTRYPNGPALTRTDFIQPREQNIPADPVKELFEKTYDPAANDASVAQVWLVDEPTPNRLLASGSSESGGTVLFGEIAYPGWKAYVDGRPQPIQRINYFFRGVKVEAGAHQIELVYQPASFILGAVVSLIAAIATLIWGWLIFRSNRSRDASM
ncbi:MAG: interleukin-like EMT inducer domain-containing protein [Candidatus Hinthialibacter antarcticus]|nr:interleukin-like EMT inducer domain-containing protein [Candidatus Hinthialibacter antarcticus]